MLRLGKLIGWHRPTFSTRTHVAVLGALVVVPLVAVQGFFSWELARRERAELQDFARRQALTISSVVDRELRSAETALHALATSTRLDERDFAGFSEQAKLVTADFPDSIIGLRNSRSEILASTVRTGGGESIHVSNVLKAADQRSLAQRQTVTTDLYRGAVTERSFVNIQVPIFKRDAEYVLSFAFDSTYMGRLITGATPEGWLVRLVDRNGLVVASSGDSDPTVGKPTAADFASMGEDSGTLAPGHAQAEVFTAYARSKLSGWLVRIDVPASTVEQPLRRTYLNIAITMLCGIAIATLFGALYARHFTRSLNNLARMAGEGSRGEAVAPVSTVISEVQDVSRALTNAFGTLKQTDESQRLLIRELHHRFKNTLAMISGIARSSGRDATDMKAYTDKLSSRLSALSRAHDVMIRRDAASGEIHDIVVNASEPFCDTDRLLLSGPSTSVESHKVVWLGMILHELFTNAVKYGALSRPAGTISIDWTFEPGDDGDWLVLRWREHGTSMDARAQAKPGFGSTLIESIATQWGGTVRREFEDTSLTVTLRLPA